MLRSRLFRKIFMKLSNNEKYIKMLRKDGVKIGQDCFIDKTAIFGTEPYLIYLDDHVRVTRGVNFITHDGALWVPRYLGLVDEEADLFGTIHVGENTNIGWNVTIMPGVTIGKNCIIGCGAIVTKNIPDNSVAVGIPAQVIETVDDYAIKNRDRCVNTKNMSKKEKKKYLMNLY